jgi:tRNA(fMet)-specific endonuclease VapC
MIPKKKCRRNLARRSTFSSEVLLDTNAVIALAKKESRFMKRARERSPSEFGISSIAAHELYFGVYKSGRIEENKNLARIDNLRLPVVEFDREDAQEAGQVRATLAAAGTPIGPYDVLIAGQAKARNLTLVTRNVREFGRVAGLNAEDWEAEA